MTTDKKNIEIRLYTNDRLYVSRVVQIKIGHEDEIDQHIEDFKRDWPKVANAPKFRVVVSEYI